MDSDVQLPEPVADLLTAATSATPGWLRRITVEAAANGGFDPSAFGDELDHLVDTTARRLVDDLRRLLSSDVDDQRTNPLSLYRAAVATPTGFLRSIGVPPPPSDRFAAERFPDDVYQLGPAAWSDIDSSLTEPGLVWGAWKAMTVLRRRRDEGLR